MTGDIILVLATVTDAFLAALSYGGGKIRIPPLSALIISLISSAVLTLSIMLSDFFGEFIPGNVCKIIGCVLLIIIGGVQLFQNGLKSLLKKHSGNGRLSFRFFDMDFVISVYIDETKADADCSKLLSVRESFALAAALSVDSVSGGIGAGFSGADPLRVCVLSFGLCLGAIALGSAAGRRLTGKGAGFSWVSGLFLILLALIKL